MPLNSKQKGKSAHRRRQQTQQRSAQHQQQQQEQQERIREMPNDQFTEPDQFSLISAVKKDKSEPKNGTTPYQYNQSISTDDPLIGVFSAAQRRRSIRVDDVLWLACFALTMLLLDVPRVILFNERVRGQYLACASMCALSCCALAFYLRVLMRLSEKFAIRNLFFVRAFFIACLLGASITFSMATWPVYYLWSAYVSIVSTFTFLAVIAVL